MSDTTNVAELRPSPAKGEGTLRLKDVTAALRAKRYRSKRKSTVTVPVSSRQNGETEKAQRYHRTCGGRPLMVGLMPAFCPRGDKIMKASITLAALLLSLSSATAQFYGTQQPGPYGAGLYGTGSNPNSHYVQPHFNSNGTFTQGHYQTNPNHTQLDNYSIRGNYNPYTGQYGTRSPRY